MDGKGEQTGLFITMMKIYSLQNKKTFDIFSIGTLAEHQQVLYNQHNGVCVYYKTAE